MSKCREEFEKHIIAPEVIRLGHPTFNRGPDDKYLNFTMENNWQLWQAAWNTRPSSRGEAVAYRYDYYEDHHEQFDFSPTPFLDSWVKIKNATVTLLYDHTAPGVVAGEVDEAMVEILARELCAVSAREHGIAADANWNSFKKLYLEKARLKLQAALTAAIGSNKE